MSEPYDDTESVEEVVGEDGIGGAAVKLSSIERCSGRPIPTSLDRLDLRLVGPDISRLEMTYDLLVWMYPTRPDLTYKKYRLPGRGLNSPAGPRAARGLLGPSSPGRAF